MDAERNEEVLIPIRSRKGEWLPTGWKLNLLSVFRVSAVFIRLHLLRGDGLMLMTIRLERALLTHDRPGAERFGFFGALPAVREYLAEQSKSVSMCARS